MNRCINYDFIRRNKSSCFESANIEKLSFSGVNFVDSCAFLRSNIKKLIINSKIDTILRRGFSFNSCESDLILSSANKVVETDIVSNVPNIYIGYSLQSLKIRVLYYLKDYTKRAEITTSYSDIEILTEELLYNFRRINSDNPLEQISNYLAQFMEDGLGLDRLRLVLLGLYCKGNSGESKLYLYNKDKNGDIKTRHYNEFIFIDNEAQVLRVYIDDTFKKLLEEDDYYMLSVY